MTVFLIKALMVLDNLRRCLIVGLGNLVGLWLDKRKHHFFVTFEIMTTDRLEASVSGHAF
ncbi:hypothetical protein ccbrp13_21430 [Ktedonobacteria bacterium brp13]|nr:hypothetical protein ccbrp13_21430 [Ktedonobacteria bacterium brp13]